LLEIIKNTLGKIKEDRCFPESFLEIFSHVHTVDIEDSVQLLECITDVVLSFHGDKEIFFGSFYNKTKQYEPLQQKLGYQQATLFFHEIASPILVHISIRIPHDSQFKRDFKCNIWLDTSSTKHL